MQASEVHRVRAQLDAVARSAADLSTRSEAREAQLAKEIERLNRENQVGLLQLAPPHHQSILTHLLPCAYMFQEIKGRQAQEVQRLQAETERLSQQLKLAQSEGRMEALVAQRVEDATHPLRQQEEMLKVGWSFLIPSYRCSSCP